MKHFILALCCVVTVGFSSASAQSQWYSRYGDRPAPPTEPSVPIPAQQQVVAPAPVLQTPKPAVRQIVVRRPHSIVSGPVNMPPAEVLVMMVRAALTALNQANFTENYSVFRGITTPTLQARMSAEQFGKAFEHLRRENLDLSPALVLAPQFTTQPTLAPGNVLKVAGIFPSQPLRINFAMEYLPIDGFWMIDSISVSASRADAAVASAAPPQQVVPAAPAIIPPAPANVPVAVPQRPATPPQLASNSSGSGFIPDYLPTTQFVPVKYRVDYRPTFENPTRTGPPASRDRRPATTQKPAAAKAAGQEPSVYVQVTSQRSEAEAKAAFNALRAKYPNILGDRQVVIRRADLGDKGIYYRAQIGPVNAVEADQQCGQLKAVGGQCFVQYN